MSEDVFYLYFKLRDFYKGSVPQEFRKNRGITMDKDVPHSDDVVPGDVAVGFLELRRKHIRCFTDYFNVLDNSEIAQFIYEKLIL